MSETILCPWCSRKTRLVWVHGHGQCEHCRTNIEPCCSGDETCPALQGDAGGRETESRSARTG